MLIEYTKTGRETPYPVTINGVEYWFHDVAGHDVADITNAAAITRLLSINGYQEYTPPVTTRVIESLLVARVPPFTVTLKSGKSYQFKRNEAGRVVATVEDGADFNELLAVDRDYREYTGPADATGGTGPGSALTPVQEQKLNALPNTAQTQLGSTLAEGEQLAYNNVVYTATATITPASLAEIDAMIADGRLATGGDGGPTVDPNVEPQRIDFNADGSIDLSVSTIWCVNPKGAKRTVTAINDADINRFTLCNTGSGVDFADLEYGATIVRPGRAVVFVRDVVGFVGIREGRAL